MQITFIPMRCDTRPVIVVHDDIVQIDDVRYDFAELAEGACQSVETLDTPVFVGPVTRRDGQIHLMLKAPYGAQALDVDTPVPVIEITQGRVALPVFEGPEMGPEIGPEIGPDVDLVLE